MGEHCFPIWAPEIVISEWEGKISEAKYWHEMFPDVEPDTSENRRKSGSDHKMF